MNCGALAGPHGCLRPTHKISAWYNSRSPHINLPGNVAQRRHKATPCRWLIWAMPNHVTPLAGVMQLDDSVSVVRRQRLSHGWPSALLSSITRRQFPELRPIRMACALIPLQCRKCLNRPTAERAKRCNMRLL